MNLEDYEEAIYNFEQNLAQRHSKRACRDAVEYAMSSYYRTRPGDLFNLTRRFQALQKQGYIKEFNIEPGHNTKYEINFYFHWSPYKNTYDLR